MKNKLGEKIKEYGKLRKEKRRVIIGMWLKNRDRRLEDVYEWAQTPFVKRLFVKKPRKIEEFNELLVTKEVQLCIKKLTEKVIYENQKTHQFTKTDFEEV